MDENNNYEQAESVDEQKTPVPEMTNEALKEAIDAQIKKVQMAALLSGSKAICGVVLQYIAEFQRQSGKKSANDYKRLIKKIEHFCSISLSKTVNENGDIVDVKNEEESASVQE